MIEVWQVDINKSYYIDDDFQIWKSEEAFYEYHFDEYHGTKDNYEQWQEEVSEWHNLQELKGIEITKLIYDEMQETIKWYRGNNGSI